MASEYGLDGFDDETIDARIDILLDAWGVAEPNEDEDDGWFQDRRRRAGELATSFPSEISDDLFTEYVAEGIIS